MNISPLRFDLMAKYLYIKFNDKSVNTLFYRELYHKHLITFNNCYEYPGTKKGIEDFYKSFNELIQNMKENGYDKNYPIPCYKGNITNGAHRLMTSYYYKITPKFINTDENINTEYNYNFFINRQGKPQLECIYADTMALEYIKHNPNIRAMVIYPITYSHNKFSQLKRIISQYGYIYYEKSVNLNQKGVNNLVKELYRGEKWIGGLFPPGYSSKTKLCIAPFPTVFMLVHMNNLSKCVELKEKCRHLFGLGKHSLHISDYPKDTFRIASSLLNDNSVHFLNNGTNDISPQTKQLLANYFKEVGENNEDYCLTSSLILEMYHLRLARDIDYLHKDDKTLSLEKTGVHEGKWLTYYHKHKEEIIYNPKYHFYFNGFKFVTLDVIKKMKENRGELKDKKDLILIN